MFIFVYVLYFSNVSLSLTGFGLPFRPSEIHQIKFATPDGVRLPRGLQHLQGDGEDGVGAGGVCVHESGARGPVLPPSFHQLLALGRVVDRVLRQTCSWGEIFEGLSGL